MQRSIDELKFVRIIVPELFAVIPRSLFENIKELDDEMIDTIRKNATSIMTVPVMNEKGVVVGNLPKVNVWIALLYDTELGIKGFLWAEFDVIENRIFIQACSVDKAYHSNDGAFIKKGVEYLRSLPLPNEMKNNIQLATTKPKAYERRGFKRSEKVIMRLNNESEKTGKQPVSDGDVGRETKPEE